MLRILVGLSEPDKGTVKLKENANILYVGHANGVKNDLTVAESFEFLARIHSVKYSQKSITYALEKLGIAQKMNSLIGTLSQGQRRRVALARLALDKRPSLWVLDEPFDALDNVGIDVINELLLNHIENEGSILLSSHLALSVDAKNIKILELRN